MSLEKQPLVYAQSSYKDSVVPRPRLTLGKATGRTRLNIVVPHFMKKWAFGGVLSALEVAKPLTAHYDSIRFISTSLLGSEEEMFDFRSMVENPDEKTIICETLSATEPTETTPDDIFFCTYWMSVQVWEEHARLMEEAGLEKNKFYYLIQDYEPGFYPFGYRFAMSQASYRHHEHTVALFNSDSLAQWFDEATYPFAERHVVAPSLNKFLRKHLDKLRWELSGKDTDRITIFMYGRPEQPRNCFAPILEGLEMFFNQLTPEERDLFWVVSAGQEHDDIALSSGILVKSLGKLTMDKYAAFLEFSHIGISFMVSPHPSYPPLEMATFGLYTITNGFGPKDVSTWHPNLKSLAAPDPSLLAQELHKAAQWALKRKSSVQKAVLPSCFSSLPWEENAKSLDIPPIIPLTNVSEAFPEHVANEPDSSIKLTG